MNAKLVLAPALWAERIESIVMLRTIDELQFSQGCTPSLMETGFTKKKILTPSFREFPSFFEIYLRFLRDILVCLRAHCNKANCKLTLNHGFPCSKLSLLKWSLKPFIIAPKSYWNGHISIKILLQWYQEFHIEFCIKSAENNSLTGPLWKCLIHWSWALIQPYAANKIYM